MPAVPLVPPVAIATLLDEPQADREKISELASIIDKILYYWDDEYIPVNAMLITGTILNAGDSSYDLED